jgi:hypothetical protein
LLNNWHVGSVPLVNVIAAGCVTVGTTVIVRVRFADGPLQPVETTVTSAEPDQPAYQVTVLPDIVGAVPLIVVTFVNDQLSVPYVVVVL